MPRCAKQPVVAWHRRRSAQPGDKGRVLLWPDTFNNYFRPGTAIAATELLEISCEVAVPDRPLCCGRPLYDWGMLDLAKALWHRTFERLRPEIEAGTPIIRLEPALRQRLPR